MAQRRRRLDEGGPFMTWLYKHLLGPPMVDNAIHGCSAEAREQWKRDLENRKRYSREQRERRRAEREARRGSMG